MKEILYFSFFYLLGSIPFGLIFIWLFGYGDIRKIGSGNIGATNVLRTGNKGLAVCTLLCDFLKGFIPCEYIMYSATIHKFYYFSVTEASLVGTCVIVGHIFPVWLKFKGGKGVATSLGVIFALSWLLGLGFIVCWLTIFALSRISSLAALVSFTFITLFAAAMSFFLHIPLLNGYLAEYFFADQVYGADINITPEEISETNTAVAKLLLFIITLIFFTHRENIVRLLKGTEHKWGKS